MKDPMIKTLTDGTNQVRVLMACPQAMFLVEDIVKLAQIESPSKGWKFAEKADSKAFLCEAKVLMITVTGEEREITNLNGACGMVLSKIKENPKAAYSCLKILLDLAHQLPEFEWLDLGSNIPERKNDLWPIITQGQSTPLNGC